MRVFDLIDIRFAQFRAFKAIVRRGCDERGWELHDIVRDGPEIADQAGARDLVLVPPYGGVITGLRNRTLTLGAASPTLVDLKGPMGIDSLLLLVDRLGARRCRYLSTMWGDPVFDDAFEAVRRVGVVARAIPFFPNPALIEQTALLDEAPVTPQPSGDATSLFFAGAIWGERAAYLSRLREAGLPVVTASDLSPRRYLEALHAAPICIDLAGGQSQTYRLHEIYLAGSCCLCQRRPLAFLNPAPRDLHEVVWFSTPEDLVLRARQLLDDRRLRTRVARDGARWYRSTQGPGAYVENLVLRAGSNGRSS